MTGELLVTPQELEAIAQRVEEQTSKYNALYNGIYSDVDSLSNFWIGEASQAFITQIRGFQNDFDSLGKLLMKYAEFLRVAGNNYQNMENINIENARTELNTGR